MKINNKKKVKGKLSQRQSKVERNGVLSATDHLERAEAFS